MVGSKFHEWNEHEVTLFHSRMRNLQARFADPLVPIYQNIQVERTRAVADSGGAVPAEFLLNSEQTLEQGARVEIGLDGDNGVEEAGLTGEANGLGGVERRAAHGTAERLEAIRGGGKGGFRFAGRAGEIRSHADVGGMHGFRLSPGARRLSVLRGSIGSGANEYAVLN